MTTAVARTNGNDGAALMEQVVIRGDLSKLTPQERANYYTAVCRSVGLNPLTKPLEYITLNGKLTLYALRNCTDQLRAIHKVSVVDMTEAERDGVCIITCKVQTPDGRTDMAKGAVHLGKLQGEALANAIMKAETKAKRRATLSICGLSLLDETEVEDIPDRRANPHVNRPEDIVDVPTADDPDRVPPNQHPVGVLSKKDARPIADKLGKELAKWQNEETLTIWKNLPETAQRVAMLPEDWREIFQGRVKERLMELRAAQKMRSETVEDYDTKLGEPEADWLDTLNDAYSKCEDAASFFDVDKKLFLPFIGSVSPDDRDRAQALRTEHLNRIEGTPQ